MTHCASSVHCASSIRLMRCHRTGVLTFAEAVGTAHTPEPRAAGFATPESALGLGADVSEPRGRRHKLQCSVCVYRSYGLNTMATHTVGGASGGGVSPICPGAQVIRGSYACAVNMQALQGQRLLDNDLLGDANPNDSEPNDHPTDTDAVAASCAMGEEHVLAIIEHIISTCTPVAEVHSLLHILQGAGTVPWKTLEPYLKVLRQWHSECGRHSVQSQDLRIKVRASPC